MAEKLNRVTEYAVVTGNYRDDRDWEVDHVSLKKARKLMRHPPEDLVYVMKVIRWGNESEGEIRKKEILLWTRNASIGKVGDIL